MARSTKGADYQHVPRPVAALADEYPPHFHDTPHSHERAQLIYASAGAVLVTTDQNVRLMEALSRLASGESVTEVAFDVGYSSSSAFTAMFRRTFGVPPTTYMSEQANTQTS